jgi:hypothetical protein
MVYEIRTFDDSYLEKHVEIGSSILSKWLGAQQTPLERLQKAYSSSNPNFDPTTKFYALRNNEIVGFLTSGIDNDVAMMEFPVVLSEHQDAEKLLIEAAYSSFRSRGITQVLSRASPTWGKTTDFVDEYGYEREKILWISSRLYLDKYTLDIDTLDVIEVDIEKDLDEIKPILMKWRDLKSEEVDSYFESLKRITERITSWKIIRKEGKIVGHDVLVQDKFDPNKARMNAIYAVGEDAEQIRDKIMTSHVNAAVESNIKYIDNFFWGPTEQLYKDYTKYGFENSDVTRYSKKL